MKRLAAGVTAGLTAPWLSGMAAVEKQLEDFESPRKNEWERLRKNFEFVKGQAYLNTATLGLMPDAVVAELDRHIHHRVRQGRYWLDPDARISVAEFVGAEKDEIAITHNTTEGINIVAQGLRLKRGDSVIISTEEHVGNALPWLNRARRDGIVLKVFSPAPTAAETMTRISDLIGPRTRAIAIPHLTCTTGQKMPVREMCALAREKGIYSFIDGAHGPGALALNMKALGVDFYAGCGHKWLCGPSGTGFLYISKERMDDLDSIFVGSNTDDGWTLTPEKQEMLLGKKMAERYSYGTQSSFQHAGLAAAVKFMQGIGMEKIQHRHAALHAYFRRGLEEFPDMEILTPSEDISHGSMLTFRDTKRGHSVFADQFRTDNVRIRMVAESGWNAFRISPHLYTLESDLDQALDSIRRVTFG